MSMENKGIKIVKQGWYSEDSEKTFPNGETVIQGEHITIIDLGNRSVDEIKSVFCVRNTTTTVTVKFDKENYGGDYFNYDVLHSAMYLDSEYDVIDSKTIRVRVELCWYTLGYSHYLTGEKMSKEDLYTSL